MIALWLPISVFAFSAKCSARAWSAQGEGLHQLLFLFGSPTRLTGLPGGLAAGLLSR